MSISIIREFPPTENNQRNSEGAFIKLKDERIAFVYSKYREGFSDDSLSDIAVSFSSDDGKTFGDSKVIFRCDDFGGTNLMSVSLLECVDGKIMIFYLKKKGNHLCQMFMQKTEDFILFSDEIQCIEDNGYFVVNNDRVVRLSNGRIVIPAAYIPIDEKGKYGRQIAKLYVSDNGGKTFYHLSSCIMPHKIFKSMGEPGILEYENGKVVLFSRNHSGRQYISYSDDYCESWSIPEPSRFTSPCSPLSCKKLSDGKVIVVYNPVPDYNGRIKPYAKFGIQGRNPLIMSVCNSNIDDEYKVLTLEQDERRDFCYVAMYELSDRILLAYCAGSVEDHGGLNRLRLSSIDKKYLSKQ